MIETTPSGGVSWANVAQRGVVGKLLEIPVIGPGFPLREAEGQTGVHRRVVVLVSQAA